MSSPRTVALTWLVALASGAAVIGSASALSPTFRHQLVVSTTQQVPSVTELIASAEVVGGAERDGGPITRLEFTFVTRHTGEPLQTHYRATMFSDRPPAVVDGTVKLDDGQAVATAVQFDVPTPSAWSAVEVRLGTGETVRWLQRSDSYQIVPR